MDRAHSGDAPISPLAPRARGRGGRHEFCGAPATARSAFQDILSAARPLAADLWHRGSRSTRWLSQAVGLALRKDQASRSLIQKPAHFLDLSYTLARLAARS